MHDTYFIWLTFASQIFNPFQATDLFLYQYISFYKEPSGMKWVKLIIQLSKLTLSLYGSGYSRLNQVKFVEDCL